MTANSQQAELVSVVLPTYERPDLARRAVESVISQTYTPIELIVVDDHSETPIQGALSDVTTKGIESVQYVRHPENRGVSAARNTGIEASSGNYIAFLDDDDQWDEQKIKRQVHQFRKSDDTVGLVATGIKYKSGNMTRSGLPTLRGDVTRELLAGEPFVQTSAVMVRRDPLLKIGGFDEELPSWNDRDLYIRLSRQCKFESVPELLTIRHIEHGDNQIRHDLEQKRDISYPRFESKHRPTAAEYGRQCERRFRASLTLALARSAMQNGYYGDARRFYVRSLRFNPFQTDPYTRLMAVIGGPYTYKPARKIVRKVKAVSQALSLR